MFSVPSGKLAAEVVFGPHGKLPSPTLAHSARPNGVRGLTRLTVLGV